MKFNCDFVFVKNSFKIKNYGKCFSYGFFFFIPPPPPPLAMIQTHHLFQQKEIPTEGTVSTSLVQKTPFERQQQEVNQAVAFKRLFEDISSTEDSLHGYRSLWSIKRTNQTTRKIMMLSTLNRKVQGNIPNIKTTKTWIHFLRSTSQNHKKSQVNSFL